MNYQKLTELLPWFLNDSLDEDERQAVAAELERSAELRAELAATREAAALFGAHPAASALVDYAEAADPAAGGPVARHLDHCADCRHELELIRESRSRIEAAPAAVAAVSGAGKAAAAAGGSARTGDDLPGRVVEGPWRRFRPLAQAAAVGALLIAGGLAGAWLTGERYEERLITAQATASGEIETLETRVADLAAALDSATGDAGEAARLEGELARLEGELEEARRQASAGGERLAAGSAPHLSVPVDLFPDDRREVMRGGQADRATVVERSRAPVTLLLPLPGAASSDRLRATVTTADGRQAWSGEIAAGDQPVIALTLTFAPGTYAPGPVSIDLDERGDDEWRPLARYPFELR